MTKPDRAGRSLPRLNFLRRLAPHLLLVPTLFWNVAFLLAPILLVIIFSFGSVDLVTFEVKFGWTWSNYSSLTDSLYLHTLVRSVALSIGTTIGCAALGFPLAFYIATRSPRRQRLWLVAVIVPFWTSFLVRTYAWVALLKSGGPVDGIGHWVSGRHLVLLNSSWAIGIGIVYSYLPLMVLPIYVALERADAALYDAAADLGATPWRQFRRVTFPQAVPGLVAGIVIVGVPAAGEYVIPQILGGGKTLMIGNIIVDQYLNVGDYPFGSALATTLIAFLLILLFLLRRAQPATPSAAGR